MNLNITFSGRFNYKQNSGVSSHIQQDYQIQLVYAGAGISKVDNDSFNIYPGDMVFIKKGSIHEFTSTDITGLKTLEIKFLCEDKSLCEIISKIDIVTKDSNLHLTSIMEKIVSEGQRKDTYHKEISESYLLQLIYFLGRLKSESSLKDNSSLMLEEDKVNVKDLNPIFYKIQDYLQNNIGVDFSMDELSKACGYNKDYLYRLIKKTTGMSIIQYINKLKLEEAKRLMKYSELHITEIAYTLGFSSVQYFSRFFKKYLGISPSEYINTARQNTRTDY